MSLTASEMTPADIAAVTNNNGNGYGDGFGGNGIWWIIVLFLIAAMFGWGNGNGFGGNGGGQIPYILNNTSNDVQRGFDQAAIMGSLNGITGAISNGFANAEISRCNANTNLLQTLNTMQMAQQQCCCDNRAGLADLKYTIATENCADRATVSDGIRDVITNATSNTQAILDKLCQLELDGKNDRIADLERQLTMANLAASQTAQTAAIQRGQTAEVDALYQRMKDCPVPTMPVYGSQPIFTCGGQTSGCGCGYNNF